MGREANYTSKKCVVRIVSWCYGCLRREALIENQSLSLGLQRYFEDSVVSYNQVTGKRVIWNEFNLGNSQCPSTT
ncbi:hypothetical protein EC9_08220 [Rosistilla ulvae]|uniref:Uncharacterized protein n=1 Tax=Rosistilla ulvae TaxID=1930277 RepID=A0A517LVL1_9BACT|nr:hypothetical protein EC9_08220 [Rosistilla ulvae]